MISCVQEEIWHLWHLDLSLSYRLKRRHALKRVFLNIGMQSTHVRGKYTKKLQILFLSKVLIYTYRGQESIMEYH